MKLHFLGANRQVTGSCYCLEANGLKIMVDRGMFQERPCLDRNWEPCPVPADQLAALVLTHVHVDHCGLIPRLVKEGFKGPIYCTPPSVELAEIVLRDSAHIQTEDARFKLKRHAKEGRQGKHPVVPLYVESDVERNLAAPARRSLQHAAGNRRVRVRHVPRRRAHPGIGHARIPRPRARRRLPPCSSPVTSAKPSGR